MAAFVNFLQPIKTSTSISLRCLSDGSYITALEKEKEKTTTKKKKNPFFNHSLSGTEHGRSRPKLGDVSSDFSVSCR